jgi:hypothetical protein
MSRTRKTPCCSMPYPLHALLFRHERGEHIAVATNTKRCRCVRAVWLCLTPCGVCRCMGDGSTCIQLVQILPL